MHCILARRFDVILYETLYKLTGLKCETFSDNNFLGLG